jgi:hypothetical protein
LIVNSLLDNVHPDDDFVLKSAYAFPTQTHWWNPMRPYPKKMDVQNFTSLWLRCNRARRIFFRRAIKTVIVWKLVRLVPSLREGVNVLADWCPKDVRSVSVTQQLDLSGTVGHRSASLLFGIAEMDLQPIKERANRQNCAKEKGTDKGIRFTIAKRSTLVRTGPFDCDLYRQRNAIERHQPVQALPSPCHQVRKAGG